jgi:broad specificity phosphatase PhoE
MFNSAPVTTLYLARHGQSEWNNQQRVTGQLDPALSPKGVEQSRALAQCLEHEHLAAIYTSALQRTRETAQPTAVAKQLAIQSLPALNEIHLGVLQGRFRDERDPQAQAMWAEWQSDMLNHRVPGGESFGDLKQRVTRSLHDILPDHVGQALLIVGHRGTNRVLMGTLMQWPPERWPDLRLRNKFLYRIRLGAAPEIATFTLSGNKKGMRHDGFIM